MRTRLRGAPQQQVMTNVSGCCPYAHPVPEPAPSVSVSPLRAKIQHRSNPLVEALGRAPRSTPIALFVLVIASAIALRGIVGGVLLCAAAAFVGWLAYLVWPRLSLPERLMRCAVLVLVLGLAVVVFATKGALI